MRVFFRNTTCGRIAYLHRDMHLCRTKRSSNAFRRAGLVYADIVAWLGGQDMHAFILARSSLRSTAPTMLPFNWNSLVPASLDLAIDNAP